MWHQIGLNFLLFLLLGFVRAFPIDDRSIDNDDNHPIDCADRCIDQMKSLRQSLINDTTIGSRSYIWSWSDSTNDNYLQEFCRIFNITQECFQSCAESQIMLLATQSLSIPQFICENYNSFLRHMPCLHKIKKSLDDPCRRNCSEQATTNVETDNFQEIFTRTCNVSKCQFECEKPFLIKECGHGAANLVSNMHKFAYGSHKKAISSATILMRQWPNNCEVHSGNDSSILES